MYNMTPRSCIIHARDAAKKDEVKSFTEMSWKVGLDFSLLITELASKLVATLVNLSHLNIRNYDFDLSLPY